MPSGERLRSETLGRAPKATAGSMGLLLSAYAGETSRVRPAITNDSQVMTAPSPLLQPPMPLRDRFAGAQLYNSTPARATRRAKSGYVRRTKWVVLPI